MSDQNRAAKLKSVSINDLKNWLSAESVVEITHPVFIEVFANLLSDQVNSDTSKMWLLLHNIHNDHTQMTEKLTEIRSLLEDGIVRGVDTTMQQKIFDSKCALEDIEQAYQEMNAFLSSNQKSIKGEIQKIIMEKGHSDNGTDWERRRWKCSLV